MTMTKNGQYVTYAVYAILIITMLSFLRTCNNRGSIRDLEKKIEFIESREIKRSDSIANLIITEEKMIRLIKEVPAWNTLRLEEISDKEKISINALKQKEKSTN